MYSEAHLHYMRESTAVFKEIPDKLTPPPPLFPSGPCCRKTNWCSATVWCCTGSSAFVGSANGSTPFGTSPRTSRASTWTPRPSPAWRRWCCSQVKSRHVGLGFLCVLCSLQKIQTLTENISLISNQNILSLVSK